MSGNQQQRPRGNVNDRAFQQAAAAHARGSFDVIKTIASELNIQWQDACNAYPAIFEHETNAILDRINNARQRGGIRR